MVASMGAFPVSLEKENQLAQRMAALGVREADIEESFVRSGRTSTRFPPA